MGTGPAYDPATTPDDPAFDGGNGIAMPNGGGSISYRSRLLAVFVAVASFMLVGLVAGQVAFTEPGGAAATPRVAVRSQAIAATVILPASSERREGVAEPVAGATKRDVATLAEHRFDATGNVAISSRLRVEATLDPAGKVTTATATAERISLFDGRIVLEQAGLTADAKVAAGRASGSFTVTPGTRATIDGAAVELTPNRQVVLEGIGTVLLNEQAIVSTAPTGDAQTGPRWRGTGALAHVRVTRDWKGIAAGTQVLIGRVDAGVRQGKVEQVAHPPTGTDPAPLAPGPIVPGSGFVGLEPGTPKPGETTLPRLTTTVRGSSSGPTGNLQGYTFPILGESSYVDTWGAARASTGIPHQGTDIFAEEGTPIVAVADGVLDRVGWNTIGGYRFWLFDRYGNSFYNAHLSAFAPLARDGAVVKAGDVIGFVGHTGDAQGTPNHLHFEIHPNNGAAVNPVRFLDAWRQGVAVAIGLIAGEEGRTAPLALLGFSDISTNDGLQESVLDSVPVTSRPIEQENDPVPTDVALTDAIEGPGTTPRALR